MNIRLSSPWAWLPLQLATAGIALLLAAFTPARAMAQTGMTQLQAPNMPITVVYPTAAAATTQTLGPFTVNVALGAAPVRGNGHLVVLSHGAGGSALPEFDLARTLAGAGFIVAQPEHEGDNWRDHHLAGPESWKLRPLEVSRTIDAVMKDPRFGPLLDSRKVGVHGMSAGGLTGLALAGGEWSAAAIARHCAVHQVDDKGFCFFNLRTAAEREQRAAMYGRPIPASAETLNGGAAVHDPRIAAIALTVPVSAIFTSESLSRITLPVGIVEATADHTLAPALHSGRVLALCHSCKALGALEGADHYDVLSPFPEVLARQAMGPDAPPSKFDRKLLGASHQRIAEFFQQTLVAAP
jgi:predicted dienelactone hydrolase